MQLIAEKWHPGHPSCAFKTYFYNKVDESRIPFYQPTPQDDPKEWEEALQAKPAAGFMPVLCTGFAGMAERLKVQRRAVGEFNARLHEINQCLDLILGRHDLDMSVRAANARRRHAALANRALALAAKVQVLRNRGYALGADEDELRSRLQDMERRMQDPALSARMEELWSRLVVLRGYADSLRVEINKRGLGEPDGLGEDVEAKAKKVGFFIFFLSFFWEPLGLLTVWTDFGGLREADPAPEEGSRADPEGLCRVGQGPQPVASTQVRNTG